MADIGHLGGLNPVEQLDLDTYPDARDFVEIPKKGRYTVQAPDSFPSSSFGRSQAGALTVQVDPIIVGPTNEGYKVRFTRISGKTWKRDGKTVSQIGEYLRACGMTGTLRDEQAQADAVESTANRTYEVDLDWRAYNTKTKFSVQGMEKFQTDAKGRPFVEDPADVETDENGEAIMRDGKPVTKRLWPQVVVSRYVPQS